MSRPTLRRARGVAGALTVAGDGGRLGRAWRLLATTESAVLLGAAGVTAAATATPWFLLLGALGCGLLAWDRLGDLRAEEAGARYRLPRPEAESLGAEARQLDSEGHRAAQAVLSEIATAPPYARELFTVAGDEVRDLYQKHGGLVRRLDEVLTYLSRSDGRRLEGERDRWRRRAEEAEEPSARSQYQEAAALLEQSLASRGELTRDAERIRARLAAIHAAFERAGAKVIRVKSAEARGVAGEGEEIARSLAALGGEVDALNEAVDEVFVRTRDASARRPVREGGKEE